MLKSRGETMATPTNFEIADIVVIELVNEQEFMEHIQPFIKKVVTSYTVISDLQDEIIKFQYEAKYCGAHTHNLKRLDFRIQKIVTVEILKHYWEKYSSEEFDISEHVPCTYHDIYIRKPKPKLKEPMQKTDTTDIYKQVADRIKQPHDDLLDTLRFTKQFTKFNKQENTMSMTKIETVVRINNADASEYSNDDIFSLIAKTEKDIEKLEAIKEKPIKLTAKIKAMQDSIKELVKIVDTRD